MAPSSSGPRLVALTMLSSACATPRGDALPPAVPPASASTRVEPVADAGSPAASPSAVDPATLDPDLDGLADAVDRCPTEPELYNDVDDDDGCPDAGPDGMSLSPTSHDGRLELRHPRFRFAIDSGELDERSRPQADALAVLLARNEHLGALHVEVHTDSAGATRHNLELSQRRAASILAHLVAHGVPAERVIAEGFGDRRPISECPTNEPRCNRRVELWFQRARASVD